MQASQLFFDIRVHFECSGNLARFLKAYPDSGNVWTIGIGTTFYPDGKPVKKGDTCTMQQAYEYANAATQQLQKAISKTVPVGITQAQFDAICDFAYNAGVGAWNGSTLRKLIATNPKDPAIEANWLQWDKSRVNNVLQPVPGLLRRRKCEYYLFANGVNHPSFFE